MNGVCRRASAVNVTGGGHWNHSGGGCDVNDGCHEVDALCDRCVACRGGILSFSSEGCADGLCLGSFGFIRGV